MWKIVFAALIFAAVPAFAMIGPSVDIFQPAIFGVGAADMVQDPYFTDDAVSDAYFSDDATSDQYFAEDAP